MSVERRGCAPVTVLVKVLCKGVLLRDGTVWMQGAVVPTHSPFHPKKAASSPPGLPALAAFGSLSSACLYFALMWTALACLCKTTWQQFPKRTYFFPTIVFSKASTGNGKKDAKSKKLMLPENSFLSLERMKRDVDEEVSKESLVSRKPLDFHASFSKGLQGSFSPGQMNVHPSVSCKRVSLVLWL